MLDSKGMAKPYKPSVTAPRKSRGWLWQGVLAAVVIGSVVLGYEWWSREPSYTDDKPSTNANVAQLLASSRPLRDRLILPATPRNPRPVTLDPNNYTDPETRAAYQAAKDVPQVLEHIACYCGCFSEAQHRNNLDCFHDKHGET